MDMYALNMAAKERLAMYVKQEMRKRKEEFGLSDYDIDQMEPKKIKIEDDQPSTSGGSSGSESISRPPLPTFEDCSSISVASSSPHSFELNLSESSVESDSSDNGDTNYKPGSESFSSSEEEGRVRLRKEWRDDQRRAIKYAFRHYAKYPGVKEVVRVFASTEAMTKIFKENGRQRCVERVKRMFYKE